MTLRIISLSLLTLCLATVPAVAQVIYSNGPINGNVDGWTINFGFAVSDTFTTNGATLSSLEFGAHLFSGDVLLNAEVLITSSEFGGTTFYDQVVSFTQQSNCPISTFGFEVCTETGSLSTTLAAGTYWLTLQNAVVNTGDPVYWDENSGPSSASENTLGTIPSEAFTLFGTTTSTTSSVPEPSSIMLFGSAILGLAGVLHRRWR